MRMPLSLRLQRAADDLLARALRDVDPRVLLVVALRGARAGRHLRLAIVLAGPHDAVTLLVLELRDLGGSGRRYERQGEGGGHGGSDQDLSIHHDLLSGCAPPGRRRLPVRPGARQIGAPHRVAVARVQRVEVRSMPKRIVIVGGGFGGAAVAARLEHLFRRDPDMELVLFDRENFSVFTPLLPEVPSGALEPKHIVSPLRARLRRTSVRQAEVRAIDVGRRVVVAGHCPMCAEYVVEYDYLVLALGSVTNFFGLPGVAARARTMKSLADGADLHDLVIGKFEHADLDPDPAARRQLLTFVVAGGGFAGVETAAELNDFVRSAGRYYPRIGAEDVRVVLVHPGDRILPEVSPSLSSYALKKLASRGVEVLLKTRIAGCDDDGVHLSNGDALPSHTLVWTAGVSANPLLDE